MNALPKFNNKKRNVVFMPLEVNLKNS